jgi:hypothetical protein
MTAIGIRLNNPGNLLVLDADEADPWQGLATPALVRNELSGHYHYSYTDPKWGIRAMVRTLHTYREVKGLTTLTEIIGEWAPSSENQTDGYIKGVATLTGVDPDAEIDVTNFEEVRKLVRAIVRWENGLPKDGREDWYTPEIYEQGLRLAGVSPTKKLADSRTMKGTATAGAASAVAGTTLLTQMLGLSPEVAALMPDALASLSAQQVAWLTIFVAVAGNLYAAWARRDDQRMGRL